MGVGSIMQEHGDIDPALDKYALVANTAPESPYMWNNLGMCYYAKSQWATVSGCGACCAEITHIFEPVST